MSPFYVIFRKTISLCSEVAQSLSDELDKRFSQQELLDALGIIYPQYWQQEGVELNFLLHLAVLKKFYYHF